VEGGLGFAEGPFVSVAAFCENVVQEKDGVLTLVRVIDRYDLQASGPQAPSEMPEGMLVQPNLVVVLKSGRALGSFAVRINFHHPNGRVVEGAEQSFAPAGGEEGGVSVVSKVVLQLSSAGIYWAEVIVNSRVVTRVPLQVRYMFRRELQSGIGPLGG
jgi:hypothetical protein